MSDIKVDESKVGGLAFYLSLISFALLAAANSFNLIKLNLQSFSWQPWALFSGGLISGIFIAKLFIRGKLYVFLHELSHAIISNLVGNKWRALVVKKNTGHFEYAYSKETAKYNAFVALAPYWLPLLSLSLGGVAALLLYINKNYFMLPFVVAVFYGMDLSMNARDVSPVQSDITNIRGGYYIGLGYIVVVNLFIFTLFAAWVSAGFDGLKYLFLELWSLFYLLRQS